MTETPSGVLLVAIGPSGAGKSTVVRALADEGIVTICPTWTTRPRRPEEFGTCPEHRFVDETVFATLDCAGFFRATGSLAGLPYRYGLPMRTPLGPGVPTVIARAEHVATLASGATPLVYQFTAPAQVVADRLAARRTCSTDRRTRLAAADREIDAGMAVAHRSFDTERPFGLVLADVRRALGLDLTAVAA